MKTKAILSLQAKKTQSSNSKDIYKIKIPPPKMVGFLVFHEKNGGIGEKNPISVTGFPNLIALKH